MSKLEGFSVDVNVDHNIDKSGAKEYENLQKKKATTKLIHGVTSSPVVDHQNDAMMKELERPEKFKAPGPRLKNIALGGLKKNPS